MLIHDITKNRAPLNIGQVGLPDLRLEDNDPLCQLVAITGVKTVFYFQCTSTVVVNPDNTTTITTSSEFIFVNGTIWENIQGPYSLTVPNNLFIKRDKIFPLITALDANGRPINDVTSFIDLSPIYGNSVAVNNLLRAFDGTGRLLTATDGDIPFFVTGLSNDCGSFDPTEIVIRSGSGDARVDENLHITAIHSLYFRNHNRISTWLKTQHPEWTDDELFFRARDINIGTFQRQVYEEYLPDVFKSIYIDKYLDSYQGYNSSLDPRITSSFDIAFRIAHSQVSLPPFLLDENCVLYRINGTLGFPGQTRPNCIFSVFRLLGSTAVIRSSLIQSAQKITGKISDLMRNIAFQSANNQNTPRFNIDVEALNLIRGRDFKSKNYNGLREFWVGESLYGQSGCSREEPMDPIKCFKYITNNNTLAEQLQSVYKHIDEIDAFIGLMLEDNGNKGDFGETSSAIILDQFRRSRSADPNYFEIFPYTLDEMDFVNESVADLIAENYDIVVKNAFRIQKSEKLCPTRK